MESSDNCDRTTQKSVTPNCPGVTLFCVRVFCGLQLSACDVPGKYAGLEFSNDRTLEGLGLVVPVVALQLLAPEAVFRRLLMSHARSAWRLAG